MPWRTIFKWSKNIHKYTGLICLLYFLSAGVSGVLLNHPSLISQVTMPVSCTPPSFRFENWNRMAMREALFSGSDSKSVIVGGRAGVWRSSDGGRTFFSMDEGYPASAFERDALCLLLYESDGARSLYAGTRNGLYRFDLETKHWDGIEDVRLENTEVVDLVRRKESVLVFTPEACYRLEGEKQEDPVLRLMPLVAGTSEDTRAPMTRFMLRLHDGSVFGMPGKLFVDLFGIVLICMTVSAVWIWYVPWKRKRFETKRVNARLFRFFHKYHLKIGVCASVFLIAVCLTGMFIRPPLRQVIARSSVPARWLQYAGPRGNWKPEIHKAVYLSKDDSLLLATRKGFFKGAADFSGPFMPVDVGVRVGGMGVEVMETLSEGRVLIGSFKGLYVWDESDGSAKDVRGNPVGGRGSKGAKGAGAHRAVGAAVKDGELQYWADYEQGLLPVNSGAALPEMPEKIGRGPYLSLWHFMFALHNGRLFQDWLGGYTWLFVPLGGLLLLTSLFSGTYDWLYRKGVFRRGRSRR